MSQSLTKLYAHLIFSTKNRQPFLDDAIRPRVHAYQATIIRGLDSPWVVVGGVADHVHILFDMGKMRAPVEFVEQAKRESSKFIKTLGEKYTGSFGNAATVCSRSDRLIATRRKSMSAIKKSITARRRFKKSFVLFWFVTALSTTNNMCGIDESSRVSMAFGQTKETGNADLGRCPRLR
jgi:REP element-mobilizing transposase RayT